MEPLNWAVAAWEPCVLAVALLIASFPPAVAALPAAFSNPRGLALSNSMVLPHSSSCADGTSNTISEAPEALGAVMSGVKSG